VIRRFDIRGVWLVIALTSALVSGVFVLAASGVATGWEIAAIIIVGSILISAAEPRPHATTPRNSFAHGAARPAAETEIQAAARGSTKTAPMHDATFPD